MNHARNGAPAGVFVQTNAADANEVLAFRRADDGTLTPRARVGTGGRGTSIPHLTSQGSVVLSDDGRFLLVANPGSDDLSVPTSLAVRGALRSAESGAWRREVEQGRVKR